MPRPNKLKYFMAIAQEVSTRATCDRAHVGAVLVRNNRILATGYNGSPRDMPHCDDAGHDVVDGHCIRTIHAEENVILQCAEEGIATEDAKLYCTIHPCVRCAMRLFQVGVRTVHFKGDYKSMSEDDWKRIEALRNAGLVLKRVED